VVEALPQLMAPLDPEMADWITQELRTNGVEVVLNDAVAAFEHPRAGEEARASVVVLKSGKRLPADLVVLGLGVRPDTRLAKEAGLEVAATGGIRVNDRLQTSDPSICVDRGVALAQWHELGALDPKNTLVLDVRTDAERSAGFIPCSLHIPLHQLRQRLGELPRDREIVVSCQSGQRSYFACRLLNQRGFRARNLTGSYRTWKAAVNGQTH
jgi:rhodanese-related sulfurtransferase